MIMKQMIIRCVQYRFYTVQRLLIRVARLFRRNPVSGTQCGQRPLDGVGGQRGHYPARCWRIKGSLWNEVGRDVVVARLVV
jgi:hypothetical protein